MGSQALYEGHWRSLEKAFLKSLASWDERPLAVVTAGYPLLERLVEVLERAGTGDLAGVQFLPGIPRLAEKLSPLPPPLQVSPADLTGCGLSAYGSPEKALSGTGFLSGMLEQGIGSEEFGLVLQSLPEDPGPTARGALKALQAFEEALSTAYPARVDTLMRETPATAFAGVFMYGFYDLNPAQRRFVRALFAGTPVTWFSPIHPSSPWRGVYERTGDFLGTLYTGRRHRVDAGLPLSPIARLGESLFTNKVLSPPPGVETIRCGSGLGFDQGLVHAVRTLQQVRPGFRVAVAARSRDRDSAALALNLAGIPTNPGVSMPLSATPFGRFLMGVCELPAWDWHNLEIRRLLASGVVFGESPSRYAERVSATGARFGIETLAELDMPFAKKLVTFHTGLPEAGPPTLFLDALEKLVDNPDGIPLPGLFHELVFNRLSWSFQKKVTLDGFRVMLKAQLEGTSAQVFPKCRTGVQVFSPEQIRGTLFDGIVLTGLEEAVLPSRTPEDPRFPMVLRKALGMSSGETREQEEAFVLRQVFEAAGERLVLVVRTMDSEGRGQRPSPLVSRLLDAPGVDCVTVSDSAPALLSPPSEAPFLDRSLAAERERLSHGVFGPHDGILGPGVFPVPECMSATMLEAYASCPFRYMVERLWRLPEPVEAPVISFPDGKTHGTLVHRALELAIAGDDPERAVRHALEGHDLKALLGSAAFASNYPQTLQDSVQRALAFFEREGLNPLASEKAVTGTIAGLPAAGRLDLLLTSPAGLVALDLKTGSPDKTRKPLEKPGLFQLPVYYALSREKPVMMGYLHVQKTGAPVMNGVSSSEIVKAMPEVEARILEIHEGISNGWFPPGGDESVCGYCGCGHLCRLSPRTRLEGKVKGVGPS
ncbi:MAG: PD-(D/E)XK nuclease family protein [Candidatus Fermentibacteraceae bacterium]